MRNGLDRYEVLKAAEPLRRGERLVQLGSERTALEFLLTVGGPARRDLHRLAGTDFAADFSGVRDEELPAELARRVYIGELKIIRVEKAPAVLRSGAGRFVVLDRHDQRRRGESWVRVLDDGTAVGFARLMARMGKDDQRRIAPVASAVGAGSEREQTRSLSRLLLRGHVRIARVETLAPATGGAPPEPAMEAFGVADAISLGVGFIPVVGDTVDILGAIVGKDLITGESLTPDERIATALGTLVGSGKAARMGLKTAKQGAKRAKKLSGFVDPPEPLSAADRALDKRAGELQRKLKKFTQSKTTTAVIRVRNPDGTTETLVASSEKRLRPAARRALKKGETAVTGKGHAEAKAIKEALRKGQKVETVAASRPICLHCQAAIKAAGARPVSNLRTTPSPKRHSTGTRMKKLPPKKKPPKRK